MENKIYLNYVHQTNSPNSPPIYSVGSDQDEAEIKYDRLSTQEWCTCKKSEKMPTADQFSVHVLSRNSDS